MKNCFGQWRMFILSGLLVGAISARGEIPTRVVFLPTGEGKLPASSELVYLDEQGLAVAITANGMDPRQSKAMERDPILVAHDPLSRLTLLRIPLEPGEKTKASDLGATLKLVEGAELFQSLEGGKEASRFVSRESTHKGKALPLELLRVHHPAEMKLPNGFPLFDAAGRLMGISYRKASEFGNGTFVFPVEAIERISKGTRKNEVVERVWFGVELLVTDPAAVVQGVLVNSPAAKAGIQKGDILLEIGKRRVTNYYQALNAFFYLLEGEATEVKVLRGTEQLNLIVTPELVPPPSPVIQPDVVRPPTVFVPQAKPQSKP